MCVRSSSSSNGSSSSSFETRNSPSCAFRVLKEGGEGILLALTGTSTVLPIPSFYLKRPPPDRPPTCFEGKYRSIPCVLPLLLAGMVEMLLAVVVRFFLPFLLPPPPLRHMSLRIPRADRRVGDAPLLRTYLHADEEERGSVIKVWAMTTTRKLERRGGKRE